MSEEFPATCAAKAKTALERYAPGEPLETNAVDFLADLHHLATGRGWNWGRLLTIAEGHYQAERQHHQCPAPKPLNRIHPAQE